MELMDEAEKEARKIVGWWWLKADPRPEETVERIAAALRAAHAAGRAEGIEAGARAIQERLDASLGPLSERAALADAVSVVRSLT